MTGKFSQTKIFKLSVVAIACLLLIIWNPSGALDPLRSGAMLAASPFQKAFYFFSIRITEAGEFVSSIGQLKADNERLIMENQELLAGNARLRDMEKENGFLRDQLGFLPRERFELLPASVISQDPHGLGNWIEIDKGTQDGLAEGMPVIISKGILIGRLQEVQGSSSKVILLTNPKSAINGAVSGSGTKGIAKGEYGLGLILDMVLQSDSLQAGDEVVTSGIGGSIPRGLYIGKVQEVHPSEDHLFQEAAIAAPVQVSKLQFVFILKGEKGQQ